jgi:hypothetical protein
MEGPETEMNTRQSPTVCLYKGLAKRCAGTSWWAGNCIMRLRCGCGFLHLESTLGFNPVARPVSRDPGAKGSGDARYAASGA